MESYMPNDTRLGSPFSLMLLILRIANKSYFAFVNDAKLLVVKKWIMLLKVMHPLLETTSISVISQALLPYETLARAIEEHQKLHPSRLRHHILFLLSLLVVDSELSNAKAIAEALARIKQAEMKAETADEVTEQTRLAKAYNMTKIDDLQTPPDLLYAALYIKDSHQYFDSLHIDSTTSPRMKDSCGKINVGQFDPKQFFASLGQQVSEIKNQGLEDPVIDPDVAIMVTS
eukprot:Gb_37923 [translate_table: standard]